MSTSSNKPHWLKKKSSVIHLPQNQESLVIGTFGIGKSTLALERANFIYEKIKKKGETPRIAIICFHQSLNNFFHDLQRSSSKNKIEMNTYFSWLARTYFKLFSVRYPSLGKYKPDCSAIIRKIKGIQPLYHHIIVVEAQQLSADKISILRDFSEGITVFANENDCSGQFEDPADLVETLSPKMPTYRFRYNVFRNTHIAGFAGDIRYGRTKIREEYRSPQFEMIKLWLIRHSNGSIQHIVFEL